MIPISIRPLRTLVAVPIALAALAFAPRAFADVLPQTSCGPGATAGQSCTTAGDGTEDGVCASATCTSSHPLPDGGFSTGTYPCLLCELVDAGAPADSGPRPPDAGPVSPDAGPTPAPDAGPETDAGASPTHLASSSSCAVAVVGAGAPGGLAIFGLGAIGLALAGLTRGRNRRRS